MGNGYDPATDYDRCSGGQINALVSTRIDIRNCIFKEAKANEVAPFLLLTESAIPVVVAMAICIFSTLSFNLSKPQ